MPFARHLTNGIYTIYHTAKLLLRAVSFTGTISYRFGLINYRQQYATGKICSGCGVSQSDDACTAKERMCRCQAIPVQIQYVPGAYWQHKLEPIQ